MSWSVCPTCGKNTQQIGARCQVFWLGLCSRFLGKKNSLKKSELMSEFGKILVYSSLTIYTKILY